MSVKWFRGALIGTAAMVSMAFNPADLRAADFQVETVFEDSLYGGAIGALVGAGTALISSKPSDNLNYITRGAGIGIIAGAVYGVFTTTRALAVIDGNIIEVGVPTVMLSSRSVADGQALALETDLIDYRF